MAAIGPSEETRPDTLLCDFSLNRGGEDRRLLLMTQESGGGAATSPNTMFAPATAGVIGSYTRGPLCRRSDSLGPLQLHYPPAEVFHRPELFDGLDGLSLSARSRRYGVNVAEVEVALKATEYPDVATVRITFHHRRC